MDDIVILVRMCWKLRRAFKMLNRHFHALWLEQHPDKTFVGRTDKGFGFLGYGLSPRGLGAAMATLTCFDAVICFTRKIWVPPKAVPGLMTMCGAG